MSGTMFLVISLAGILSPNGLLNGPFQSSLDNGGPTLQSNSMEMNITKESQVVLEMVSPGSLDEGSLSFSDRAPTSARWKSYTLTPDVYTCIGLYMLSVDVLHVSYTGTTLG